MFCQSSAQSATEAMARPGTGQPWFKQALNLKPPFLPGHAAGILGRKAESGTSLAPSRAQDLRVWRQTTPNATAEVSPRRREKQECSGSGSEVQLTRHTVPLPLLPVRFGVVDPSPLQTGTARF